MSRHLPANRETAQKGRDHVVAELCRRGASSVGFIVVGQQPQLIASTAIGTVSLRVKTRYSGDWFELFVERVNGLMNTKLGRDGFGVNMEMHFESGKGLFYMFEQPEEDALQSFLLTFRQFVSQGEPVHLPAIYKLCLRHIANETVKSNLVKSRESWKKAVAGASIGLTIDSRAFTPEQAMDIWINGYYFHSDTEHREALAKLGGLNGTLVRLWFLNCVIWSADVVQYVGYSIRYALVLQREIIGSQFMKPPQPALAMGAIGCGFAAMLVRQ